MIHIDNIVRPVAPAVPNFDSEVLAPLRAQQQAAAQVAAQVVEEARQAEVAALAEQAKQATLARQAVLPPQPVVVPAREVQQAQPLGGLTGSYGYAIPYGNCVNEPGVNNPHWGNPISWPATSATPWIGASALFSFNHVAVVTGIWSNGDIEVRHQNFTGGQHRFPRSMFRGFR